MTAEVIRLRNGITAAQRRRVIEWAQAEVASFACSDDRTLCQEIALLMHKIDLTAFLAGAVRPSSKEGRQIIRESGRSLDQALLHLHEAAESVFRKAINQYPATTDWPGRPRRAKK